MTRRQEKRSAMVLLLARTSGLGFCYASYPPSERLTQSCFVRRGGDWIHDGGEVGFAMTTALRDDSDGQGLRVLARQGKQAG